jgi:hypothetical protein
MTEATRVTGATRVTDADEGLPSLARHAESIEQRMRDVELAEADYAALRRRAGRPGSLYVGSWASRRIERAHDPAFARLCDAVGGLCSAWQLFRLAAAAEALTWQAALELTLPALFGSGGVSEAGLRQDTVFSYSVVKSDEDVMKCFLWRLARGYC